MCVVVGDSLREADYDDSAEMSIREGYISRGAREQRDSKEDVVASAVICGCDQNHLM